MLFFFSGTNNVLWVVHFLQNRGEIIFYFVKIQNSVFPLVAFKGVHVSRKLFCGLRRIKILKGPRFLNVWETLIYSFTIG
jgi:hypothetical protein